MTSLIVGDIADPHVSAVASKMRAQPLVLDASSLSRQSYELSRGRVVVDGVEIGSSDLERGRGWLRRFAPDNWHRGALPESREWAERAAWLTLLGAIVRDPGTDWLTDIDKISASENKLAMYAVARRIGISVPHTVVTSDRDAIEDLLGTRVVVKPLGPGWFATEDVGYALFAQSISRTEITAGMLRHSPFLVQQRLEARSHARIVTVRGRAWGASLSARGLPLDWRQSSDAHGDFHEIPSDSSLLVEPLRLATHLALGYSSQDWVITEDGAFLVDANPSGQWLFLPQVVAASVSQAIADWLDGE